jgi:hypothetical protein
LTSGAVGLFALHPDFRGAVRALDKRTRGIAKPVALDRVWNEIDRPRVIGVQRPERVMRRQTTRRKHDAIFLAAGKRRVVRIRQRTRIDGFFRLIDQESDGLDHGPIEIVKAEAA